MNIPDKAVTAGVRAATEGAELHPNDRAYWEATVRDILEAAVPYIAAQAWDEGRESLARDFTRPIGEGGMRPSTPNPYLDPQ